jgi:hypothetical protein
MTGKLQVTVTLGDRQVTLEGPEDFVRAEVQRLTNLVVSLSSAPAPVGGAENKNPTSEREFVSRKKPDGHAETVAVLAYYLREAGQEEFTPEDIRRGYVRAGVRPPKVIAQSVRDAKNVHDYLERGSGRGTFRLSTHGARTVEFDLPR